MRMVMDMHSNGIVWLMLHLTSHKKLVTESIFEALANDDMVALQSILYYPYNRYVINEVNNEGVTPLMEACINGNLYAVCILLKFGANVEVRDAHGTTAAMFASNGHPRILEELIARHCDFNARDIYGGTSLMLASLKGFESCVRLLIQHGADVNSKDNKCRSPIIFAASKDQLRVVEMLLEANCDPNSRDNQCRTPLIVAASSGYDRIVRLLLQQPTIDINARDINFGATALIFATLAGERECINALLGVDIGRSIDMYARDHHGRTALHIACTRGHYTCLQSLLDSEERMRDESNPDKPTSFVNIIDNYGATALSFAAIYNNYDFIPILIDKGANMNHKDNSGKCPLHLGSTKGHTRCVDTLIQRGAHINLVDTFGHSPLMAAASSGHTETVHLLLEYGANTELFDYSYRSTALMMASLDGYTDCVQELLNHRVSPHTLDILGRSALTMSCSRGHASTLQLLVEAGCDTNIRDSNYGMTPLILACNGGFTDCVSILLMYGADINIKDHDGRVALQYARNDEIRSLIKQSETRFPGFLFK